MTWSLCFENLRDRMRFKQVSGNVAKSMLVAAAFSLVLPTAWISLFLILFLLFWVLSGDFHLKSRRVAANPAALTALALFAFYGVGTLYSSATWEESLEVLGKYHKLLFIPVIVSLLDDKVWRRRAGDAFFWGMMLVLAISYLKWLGWYPHQDIGQGYFVFKGRIAHNIFMAFALFLVLERAYLDHPRRWLWVTVAVLVVANVLFLVNGRTGQVLLPLVFMLFASKRWGWRPALGATAAAVALFAAALAFPPVSAALRDSRMLQINQEIESHHFDGSEQTSSGQRLEFYRNTLALIGEHPLFGWGTGSFEAAYRNYAERHGYALSQVSNPHNEYLLTMQQLGLAGLLMLLFMGWTHWRAARQMDPVDAERLHALILVIGVGALFNSLLFDAGEGKFYCLLAGVYLSGWGAPDVKRMDNHVAS